jgi:hypothetical protein
MRLKAMRFTNRRVLKETGDVIASYFRVITNDVSDYISLLVRIAHIIQEDSGTGGFLASKFHFHGWKSPEIAWGEIWTP